MRKWIGLLMCVAACGGPGTPMEQSCSGEAVPNCLPYEASSIVSAEVTPSGLVIDDPSVMVDIRIQLDICDAAPSPHEITLRLRTLSSDDAGSSSSLLDLLTLRDDGRTEGDAVAGDGLIEVSVPSPFIGSMIPANQNVALRFVSRGLPDCSGAMCIGGTCRSDALEIPFRTGRRFVAE